MTFEEAIAQVGPGEQTRFGPERVDPAYVAAFGLLSYNHDWGDPGLLLDADPEDMPQPSAYLRREFLPPNKPFCAVLERDMGELDLYIVSGPYMVVSERLKLRLLQEPGLCLNVWPVEAKWRGGIEWLFLLAPLTSTRAIDASRTPFVVKNGIVGDTDKRVSHLIFQREYVFTDLPHPSVFYDTYGRRLFMNRYLAQSLKSAGMTGFRVSFSREDELRA